jgi:hypothetical protein
MVASRPINVKTTMAESQVIHIILGDGDSERAFVARVINEAISNSAVDHDSDINGSAW